jgi:hypothetical protein
MKEQQRPEHMGTERISVDLHNSTSKPQIAKAGNPFHRMRTCLAAQQTRP